ncbi:permease [Bifidobacterium sp. DSM 109958]|uniref:Permease n=1 Tax=Bifidobacterium moraviense TaxID=2675323 RepID=A0A7Y0F021_9BIFI|nr:AEC family transporter [Bifidobacterium sp. DSM 109958]NMM99522.1 permease [Bifidobacterium sp. DSM 109958]
MGQFGIVVGQLVGFLIMLMVGYGCVRLKLYGTVALNGMCALLLNVLIPVLVFANAMDGATRADLAANWGVMLLTALMYALLALVFFALAWALRLKGERGRIFQAALIFGNAGFLGIPLIMALFPGHGAIYVALMSIVDQSILWTYGVYLCEPIRGAAASSVRPSVGMRAAGLLRRFVNPAFIGIMLALALILMGVRVPELVLSPLHTIGAMATPMSLIYLGGLFATTRWWSVLRRYELYVGLTAKMILFPIGLYALLTMTPLAGVLPVTHDMTVMIAMIAGLPTMTTIAMFCGRRGNMPEYATGFVLVSTLFSLVSLAVVSSVIM